MDGVAASGEAARTARLSRRQQAFRAEFRAQIGRLYHGWVHVALIYAIGGAAIWYCARQVGSPSWAEWLVVPIAFLLANIFEWWIHRYVMHRPLRGLMGIYKRHTLAHHQFFTEHAYTLDDQRDFRIVFFPPYALVAFLAMSLVPAFLLNRAGLPDAGWLLLMTNTALYLNYEFFHFCCHVKDDRIVRWIPFINTIRRHHAAHHNTSIMMERNFNLTYPIADWLFGTSDLRRGLLGHLLNGYGTRHLRTDLRQARHGRDDPRAGRPRAPLAAAE